MQRAAGKSVGRDDAPSAEEMKARARSIVDDLKKLAPEAEKLRRLPKESVALLKRQHLGRTIQPKSCGGYGLSMRSHVDVVSTVAEGCGASAWVLAVVHAHSWLAGHLPSKAQQDIFGADPDMFVSAVIGPRGKAIKQANGSYRLSGVWPFASGCDHAGWFMFGAEVFDQSGAKLDEADLLVPASEVQILDDWHVAGLQGTGSSTVKVTDLEVPGYRYVSLPGLLENELPSFKTGDDEWLTRAQATPVLGLCITTAALGIARAALAEFIRSVPGKRVTYTNHIADEWIPTQVALGEAAAMINAAELVTYRSADDIDDWARRGEKMPMELRGRIRMDCSYSVRLLSDAVDRLFVHAGASGLSLKGPMQRAARDLKAINMHGLLLFETGAELYGRILLGKGSNSPII